MKRACNRRHPLSSLLLVASHRRLCGTTNSIPTVLCPTERKEVISLNAGMHPITSSLEIDIEKRLSSISILSNNPQINASINEERSVNGIDACHLLQSSALTWKQSLQLLATASDAITKNDISLSSSPSLNIRRKLLESKKHLLNEYNIFWTMIRQGHLVPDLEKYRIGVESCAGAVKAKQVNDIQLNHISMTKNAQLRLHSSFVKFSVPSSHAYSLAKKSMMHLVALRDEQSLRATWYLMLNGATNEIRRHERVIGMNQRHLRKFLVDITEALIDLVATPNICNGSLIRNDLQHATVHRLAHRSYFSNLPDDLSLTVFVQCLNVIPDRDLKSIERLKNLWTKKWNPPHAFDNAPNLGKLGKQKNKTRVSDIDEKGRNATSVRTLHVFGLVDKNSHVLLPANLRVKLFSSASDVALSGTLRDGTANSSIWLMNNTQLKVLYSSYLKSRDVLLNYTTSVFGENISRNVFDDDVIAIGSDAAILAAYLARDTTAMKSISLRPESQVKTLMSLLFERAVSMALKGNLVQQETLLRRIFRRNVNKSKNTSFFTASGLSPLEASEAIHLGFSLGTIQRRNNNRISKDQKYPWARKAVKRHLLATLRYLSNSMGSINSLVSILNLATYTSYASGVLSYKPNEIYGINGKRLRHGKISSLQSVPWAGDMRIFNSVMHATSVLLTSEALDKVTHAETEALGLVSKTLQNQWRTPVSKLQRSVFCPDNPFTLLNVRITGCRSVCGFVIDLLLADNVFADLGLKRYPHLEDSQRVALIVDCINAGAKIEIVKACLPVRLKKDESIANNDNDSEKESSWLPNWCLGLCAQLISKAAYERKVERIEDPVTKKVFEALKVTSKSGLVALRNLVTTLSSVLSKDEIKMSSRIYDGKGGETFNASISFSDIRSHGFCLIRSFLGGPEDAFVLRRQMVKSIEGYSTCYEQDICLRQQERYAAEVRLRRENLICLAGNSTNERELLIYMSTLNDFDRYQFNSISLTPSIVNKISLSNDDVEFRRFHPNVVTKAERLLICEGVISNSDNSMFTH